MSQQNPLFQADTNQDSNAETKTSTVASLPRLTIIDGHALAFRSYYAIRNLSNSQGRPVNAVFGFLRSLIQLLQEDGDADATIVTFDAPAKTFRHEAYPEYKAGRAPAPDDFHEQVDTIRKAIDLLGVYRIEVAGLEADDLMGTMAVKCADKGYRVELVTSDRDAYQLVNEQICVRSLSKNERFFPADVEEKYGVSVAQWVDYRSLTGDSSDNIPGAKGIGPKTASKLLQNYGTLDYILAHAEDIKPASASKKVIASRDNIIFSKELSCIVTDADIPIAPEQWAQHEMDREALSTLLDELEFDAIKRQLGLESADDAANVAKRYKKIKWGDGFFGGTVGFVLSEPRAMHAQLEHIAVAHHGALASTVAVPDVVDDATTLWQHLEHSHNIHAANAKALCVWARFHNLQLEAGDDPLLMAYLIDPNRSDIESISQQYTGQTWTEDVSTRASISDQLIRLLPQKMDTKQRHLYENLEKPLQNVLANMEATGICLDVAAFAEQTEALSQRLAAIEKEVRDYADNPELNLNSRNQLESLLYDKLGLSAGKKTATGKRSTAVAVLENLREAHPAVRLILEHRELAKLKGTYLEPLPKLLHPETGRLHTTFNQAEVSTGRLSSVNPNLQNIPVRTEIGRQIRKGFVAAAGHTLLVADYSQIELRILAHVADEPALIASFQEGEDIHSRTGAQIFGVELAEVTSEMRRTAKVINFGVLYGMSAHRLSREIDVPFEEADSFINNYFKGYPKVQQYIDDTLEFARQHGYVETMWGRRRLIPDITSKNRNQREYAERTAYNMPIQGAAADVMKQAMLDLHANLQDYEATILLQVHDELIVEVLDAQVDEVAEIMQHTMQDAVALSVPLKVEVGKGQNWLEAK